MDLGLQESLSEWDAKLASRGATTPAAVRDVDLKIHPARLSTESTVFSCSNQGTCMQRQVTPPSKRVKLGCWTGCQCCCVVLTPSLGGQGSSWNAPAAKPHPHHDPSWQQQQPKLQKEGPPAPALPDLSRQPLRAGIQLICTTRATGEVGDVDFGLLDSAAQEGQHILERRWNRCWVPVHHTPLGGMEDTGKILSGALKTVTKHTV